MSTIPDSSPLARALGRIPTGLYLVTSLDQEQPVGFVGSFLMQVGFEPPTLCLAVGHERGLLPSIRRTGRFAVSILDASSSRVMKLFLRRYPLGESPFDHVEHFASPAGLPVIAASLAWLECKKTGEHELEDHAVIFGTVERADVLREGDPSIHLRRSGFEY